jgi:molecular chaperone GrpE (heat shock protein)
VGEGDDIRQSLAALHSRLERLETAVEATSKQISLLPAQVRTMGLKLDGVATSIAEPRYRDVLLGLLAVYDLVDQILRGLQGMKGTGDEAHAEHRRNYDVLRLHLLQVLAANGLTEIPASDVFDPTQHRAVQRVPTADRGLDGQVREVVRRGFRTERAVLRYAEVVVYRYASDACCGEMPQT